MNNIALDHVKEILQFRSFTQQILAARKEVKYYRICTVLSCITLIADLIIR